MGSIGSNFENVNSTRVYTSNIFHRISLKYLYIFCEPRRSEITTQNKSQVSLK